MAEEQVKREPIFIDRRKYYCQFCNETRSKKTLLNIHILSNHPEEYKKMENEVKEEKKGENKCQVCGDIFKKHAYLKQHMDTHSLERPFVCHFDGCQASYQRKDKLTRHIKQHEGKLFKCTVEGCDMEFTLEGNMKRHVREMHYENSLPKKTAPKKYVCQEEGCGKEFVYSSRLEKHKNSHVKLDDSVAMCGDPNCLKKFSNSKCLQDHMISCHLHVPCDVCGDKHLKKNMKRHLRTHEKHPPEPETIKCNFEGCYHKFTTNSNLQQHVKAVHLKIKPFVCSISGCGMRFTFKHVRDNHENSSCHNYVHGDIEEFDQQFTSRPRGGVKRAYPSAETLTRKRVMPPSQSDRVNNESPDYLAWLLSMNSNEQ